MKAADYAALGAGTDITFMPKTDRAKQRTPEPVVFKDRARALEYMVAAEAEGYRFLNARNLDPTRQLVPYGYFAKGPDGELTPARRKRNWGPLDTDYEPGDSLGVEDGKEGIIRDILTGDPAVRAGVGVVFLLEERDAPSTTSPSVVPPASQRGGAPRSGEWNLAVLSGLITGVVLGVAIRAMGPSGLIVVGFVYAFFIQNKNFRFNGLQKIIATLLALVIGTFGSQLVETFGGLYR